MAETLGKEAHSCRPLIDQETKIQIWRSKNSLTNIREFGPVLDKSLIADRERAAIDCEQRV